MAQSAEEPWECIAPRLGMNERTGKVTKMLLLTGQWTANVADVTKEYRVHIEARIVELEGVRGFTRGFTGGEALGRTRGERGPVHRSRWV